MDASNWSTKEEVLNDLALGSGDFNWDLDGYIVVGERPPPHRIDNIDNFEVKMRFGPHGDLIDSYAPPDLDGIQKMLRMVEEPTHSPHHHPNPIKNAEPEAEDDLITISKFNPDAKEFVPKNDLRASPEKHETNNNNANIKDAVENNDKNNKVSSNDAEVSETAENNLNTQKNLLKTDRNILCSSESVTLSDQEIEVALKNKIINTTTEGNFIAKKERNLAIASLLKLYSRPSTSIEKAKKIETKPVLITPNFFENPKAVIDNEEHDNIEKSDIENESIVKNTINNVEVPPKVEAQETQPSFDEIKVSKIKVEDWLENKSSSSGSPKPKAPCLHVGPIAYKKKQPSSKATVEPKAKPVEIKQLKSKCYQPSAYAKDLEKKYLDKLKEKEIQNDTIWTKLERELKERDVIIRNRLKNQSVASTSSTSNDAN